MLLQLENFGICTPVPRFQTAGILMGGASVSFLRIETNFLRLNVKRIPKVSEQSGTADGRTHKPATAETEYLGGPRFESVGQTQHQTPA